MSDRVYHIRPVLDGQTLAGALRGLIRELSWTDARRLIETRRVQINGNLATDDTRRLKAGDVVKIFEQSRAPVPTERDLAVRHVDEDLIVIEKPPGVTTLRHAEEKGWDDRRKQRQPTLDELVQRLLPSLWPPGTSATSPKPVAPPLPADLPAPGVLRRRAVVRRPTEPVAPPRVRPVHRLDRDTSGLMVFALSERAEHVLIERFKHHEIRRTYQAVVVGLLDRPLRLESWMVRDRGDGLRGSVPQAQAARADGQRAVTHVTPIRTVAGRYTLVECRLETGRTHQIRIHLAEAGHMLCGERTYVRATPGAAPVHDESSAPRQVLHSAALQLDHPISQQPLSFTSEWPRDLARWLAKLDTSGSRNS